MSECVKLRILNVLAEMVPMIPQTPQMDLKYPYVPEMAIWTHCAAIFDPEVVTIVTHRPLCVFKLMVILTPLEIL